MKRYPDEVAEYISAHVEGMTTKQLTSDLNNIFAHKYNLNFTEAKIKSYKTNHGLKSKTKGGMPKGFSKVYPDGMEDFVRSIANGKTTKELTEAVNEKYGAGTITAKKMRAYKKNHNIVSGIDCKFQPGHIPDGKMVSFLDGNKDNCSIENLFLTDNATNLEMNRQKLRFKNPELTAVGEKVARLNIAIRNKEASLHG